MVQQPKTILQSTFLPLPTIETSSTPPRCPFSTAAQRPWTLQILNVKSSEPVSTTCELGKKRTLVTSATWPGNGSICVLFWLSQSIHTPFEPPTTTNLSSLDTSIEYNCNSVDSGASTFVEQPRTDTSTVSFGAGTLCAAAS